MDDWKELEPKKKIFLIVVAIAGIAFITIHHFVNEKSKPAENQDTTVSTPAEGDASGGTTTLPGSQDTSKQHLDVLPKTNRNLGLEDLNTRLDQIEAMVKSSKGSVGDFLSTKPAAADGTVKAPPPVTTAAAPVNSTATVSLDKPLDPGKVDFNEPPTKAPGKNGSAKPGNIGEDTPINNIQPPRPAPAEMKIWKSEDSVSKKKAPEEPGIVIPVNSALDGVMLSGINARQPGSSTGAASGSVSALNVGAPFVTRLKGDAILPNGWKLSQLGDCFLGGSAVAILSTERANAIADTISCIAPNGEIWEAPVKAYALDVDGTLGIAGKVVSKQGAILMQTALAGLASGLGSAFAPTSLPSYNSTASSGSTQGYQLPNSSLIVGSAVGQGVSTAAGQLSKFYLDYAREIFPVVEVVAGTRVTWILKESIELKKTNIKKVATK